MNCFYVQAQRKKEQRQELYYFKDIFILEQFSLDKFLAGIENGIILIDFDARTKHNHGTKFRVRKNRLPDLYGKITRI